MVTPGAGYPFDSVVLVADSLDESVQTTPIHLRRDLEMSDRFTLDSVNEALESLRLRVVRYSTPAELCANIGRHRSDVVLPLFGGEISRNRLALVPAICEANGVCYIGPDAYGSIICQDKEISKNLARDCGLRTPWHLVIRSPDQAERLEKAPTPFVVKPLFEGSSIGITQRNLVTNPTDGRALACELLSGLGQPVIVEGFVKGREVSYNCIERSGTNHWSFSEVYVVGDDDYFDHHLFDAEEKMLRRLPRTVRAIDDQLSEVDRKAMDHLLATLGHFGYCRIDGKHVDGQFEFIEITPDPWLAPTGAFAAGFTGNGWSYADVILAIVLSAFRDPRGR